jgi:hypothetical protein
METHNKKSGMNAESGRRRVGPDAQAGSRRHRAFTPHRNVGVLAVIAILTCILIPVVFELSTTPDKCSATSVATTKTACVEHFAKFGSLSVDGTVSPVSPIALDGSDTRSSDFDLVLLQENCWTSLWLCPSGLPMQRSFQPWLQMSRLTA